MGSHYFFPLSQGFPLWVSSLCVLSLWFLFLVFNQGLPALPCGISLSGFLPVYFSLGFPAFSASSQGLFPQDLCNILVQTTHVPNGTESPDERLSAIFIYIKKTKLF